MGINFPEDKSDAVKHPSHYTAYEGFAVMDICTQVGASDGAPAGTWHRANVVKYLLRAGLKDPGNLGKEIEDLCTAQQYLELEIVRLEKLQAVRQENDMVEKYASKAQEVADAHVKRCPACEEALVMRLVNDQLVAECPEGHGWRDLGDNSDLIWHPLHKEPRCPECTVLLKPRPGMEPRFMFCPNGHGKLVALIVKENGDIPVSQWTSFWGGKNPDQHIKLSTVETLHETKVPPSEALLLPKQPQLGMYRCRVKECHYTTKDVVPLPANKVLTCKNGHGSMIPMQAR